jgi:hypothetical protein
VAGDTNLTLTIRGTNFGAGPHRRTEAVWLVNGIPTLLATTVVSATELTAVIPEALMRNPVFALVVVQNSDSAHVGVSPAQSRGVSFVVHAPPTGLSTIILYGQRSSLPPIAKGERGVSLDGSPWRTLVEADSVIYSPVRSGDHELRLSNPCTGTHVPTVENITVMPDDTLMVVVFIPGACE